jgi:hypothetical protein
MSDQERRRLADALVGIPPRLPTFEAVAAQ